MDETTRTGAGRRPGDSPAAVRARLRDYHAKTRSMLDLFRAKEVVAAVDAGGQRY